MKVYLTCMECLVQDGRPSLKLAEAEITEKFYFETTCEKGHKTITLLQQEKFEVLYDFGISALLDGYYREAVSSIASSVERFHEYVIRVVTIHNNLYTEEFNKIWSNMSSQSERQLGAFYYLYLSEFKCAPPDFVKRNASFRNDVIHKGFLPSRDKALSYAEDAFNYIVSMLVILKESHQDSMSKLTSINLQKAIPKDNKLRISTMGFNSIIGLLSGEKDWKDRMFSDVIEKFRQNRERNKRLAERVYAEPITAYDAEEKGKSAIYRTHYDPKTGQIRGFYPSAIDYPSIPAPIVELSYEEWQTCLSNQGKCKIDVQTKKIILSDDQETPDK